MLSRIAAPRRLQKNTGSGITKPCRIQLQCWLKKYHRNAAQPLLVKMQIFFSVKWKENYFFGTASACSAKDTSLVDFELAKWMYMALQRRLSGNLSGLKQLAQEQKQVIWRWCSQYAWNGSIGCKTQRRCCSRRWRQCRLGAGTNHQGSRINNQWGGRTGITTYIVKYHRWEKENWFSRTAWVISMHRRKGICLLVRSAVKIISPE